jgi:hypothetical protein
MSRRKSESSSTPSVAYRKPRAGVYTMLLVVALLCLIVGTVFLFLETKDYGPNPFSFLVPQGAAGASGTQGTVAASWLGEGCVSTSFTA